MLPWIDPKWISVAHLVGMAFGAAASGWVSDKLFNSKHYLAIMLYMTLSAITALYKYTIPDSDMYNGPVVLFLDGFFVYRPQSSFWALRPDLIGHKRTGTATGVMNFFVYLFTGLGEPLIGYFMNAHHDTSLVFLIVAVAGAASTVMALFIWREGRE